MEKELTPKQIVERLDQYINGQQEAEKGGGCCFAKPIPSS